MSKQVLARATARLANLPEKSSGALGVIAATRSARSLLNFLPLFLIGALLHAGIAKAADTQPAAPWLDRALPVDQRVKDLISNLTIEEKAMLLNHRGPTVERFNIRADQWNQCLNGVKWDRPTTLFPSCVGMAATWNVDLVQNEIAKVLSDEARAIYNGWHIDPKAAGEHKGLIYRAPVINIERNPYWGRNHEAWGEDSYLTGRMAVAYVRGLQGDDPKYLKLAATLKHYAVNNVEINRKKLNCTVSERMLREYWLPHFKDAVMEGKAQSLMASYNAINGTPNNINHWLLTEVLKGEWKHEGFVVSDLGGVRTMVEGHEAKKMAYVDAVAQSLMAGCDFSDKEFEQNIPAAVKEGKLTEERLNDALTRVLTTRFRLGEFDPFDAVPYSKISPSVIDSAEHRAVALKTAQQSIVLLQNRDQFLPLDRAKLKKIAVIGPLADRLILNNYNGKAGKSVTPLQGIRDRAASGTEVSYAVGGMVAKLPQDFDAPAELQKATALAKGADVAIVFVGTDRTVEQENLDRTKLGLSGNQEELVESIFAANPRTVVVQLSAGPLTVPWLKEHIPAMLQGWWPGEVGGHAIADVLFGDYNPAGRLPHTVYASEAQVPPLDEYDITKGFTYMYVRGDPLFAFGHGLSYSKFDYGAIALSSKQLPGDGKVAVSLDITNSSQRPGDEVIQVYAHQTVPEIMLPAKKLVAFTRIHLEAGEKKTVALNVSADRLCYFDEKTHAFITPAGPVELLVGAASDDIRQKAVIEIPSAVSVKP